MKKGSPYHIRHSDSAVQPCGVHETALCAEGKQDAPSHLHALADTCRCGHPLPHGVPPRSIRRGRAGAKLSVCSFFALSHEAEPILVVHASQAAGSASPLPPFETLHPPDETIRRRQEAPVHPNIPVEHEKGPERVREDPKEAHSVDTDPEIQPDGKTVGDSDKWRASRAHMQPRFRASLQIVPNAKEPTSYSSLPPALYRVAMHAGRSPGDIGSNQH